MWWIDREKHDNFFFAPKVAKNIILGFYQRLSAEIKTLSSKLRVMFVQLTTREIMGWKYVKFNIVIKLTTYKMLFRGF